MRKIKSISVVCAQAGKTYEVGMTINNLKINEILDLTSESNTEGVIAYLIAKDINNKTVAEFLNVPIVVEYFEN